MKLRKKRLHLPDILQFVSGFRSDTEPLLKISNNSKTEVKNNEKYPKKIKKTSGIGFQKSHSSPFLNFHFFFMKTKIKKTGIENE